MMTLLVTQVLWVSFFLLSSLSATTRAFMIAPSLPTKSHLNMAAGKEGGSRDTDSTSSAKKEKETYTPRSVVEKAILELASQRGGPAQESTPKPPPVSPNANDILSQLSAQVSGLHKEREQQTKTAKEQLAETQQQLKALKEEYETYRADISKKLSLLPNNNGGDASNDDNTGTATSNADEENKYKRLIYDLQEQLVLQVEATEQQLVKRAQLERQLKDEHKEILRLRDSMHDARARHDEKKAQLQEQIQTLEMDLKATSAALRDAKELLDQRDVQIATLQANNQSLRKLAGKMRRLIVKRTRHRLDMIKERILHPLQRDRHRPKSRSAIRKTSNNNTKRRRYSSIATSTRTNSTTQAYSDQRPRSVALVDKEK